MTRSQPPGPTMPPTATPGTFRSPKTAELVAATLRRMIVDGQLSDGDFLPHETELMTHFKVSRPTLREAVRVLEAERLVEVRRGSRTGARVLVPGPEIVARPAGLLLELANATLADVWEARVGFEPLAVRLLAEDGSAKAHAELRRLVDEIPTAADADAFATATANFHRRVVELSGNATLGMIAGMLYEITVRHTTTAIRRAHAVPEAEYARLLKSYHHLVELVAARNGTAAEKHWRRHMGVAGAALLKGYEKTRVRDIMD